MKRRPENPRPVKRPRPAETKHKPVSDGTICAIATPPGEGGIGIIRVSGGRSAEIASRIFTTKTGRSVLDLASHTLHLGTITDPSSGERLDEAMLVLMQAPRTYTRADTVEIYCHGGAFLLHRILDLLIRQGARLADPGEFTKWAFLNGRIGLTQAEAVMDLIRSKTEAGQRAALAQLDGVLNRQITQLRDRAISLLAEIEAGIDFTEEDIEFLPQEQIRFQLNSLMVRVEALLKSAAAGKALREGIATAIVGRPNAGKSSLLNALLMQNRAIVTPIPGTTRDVIEDYLNLDGIPFRIMDTAGLRETEDLVEREGVLRTRKAIEQADLVLLIIDAHEGVGPEELRLIEETAAKPRLIIFNKMDLLSQEQQDSFELNFSGPNPEENTVYLSVLTGRGTEALRKTIAKLARSGIVTCGEREAMVNTRQKHLLLQVKSSLGEANRSLDGTASPELIAMDIRAAIDRLGEICGESTTDDLLDRIFKDFCIGK